MVEFSWFWIVGAGDFWGLCFGRHCTDLPTCTQSLQPFMCSEMNWIWSFSRFIYGPLTQGRYMSLNDWVGSGLWSWLPHTYFWCFNFSVNLVLCLWGSPARDTAVILGYLETRRHHQASDAFVLQVQVDLAVLRPLWPSSDGCIDPIESRTRVRAVPIRAWLVHLGSLQPHQQSMAKGYTHPTFPSIAWILLEC